MTKRQMTTAHVAALTAACLICLTATPARTGLTSAARCEGLKNKEAGKYALCLEKAQMKLVTTPGVCSTTASTVCYRDDECPGGETCDKDTTKYNTLVDRCDQKLSNQWTKWEANAGASCPTTGDEAIVQNEVASAAAVVATRLSGVRFVDNGDGTVTDVDTGLIWEEKTNDGSIHDRNNTYRWGSSAPYTAPDGEAFTTFLAALNYNESSDGAALTSCFAGHCDWRLPTVTELQTILLETPPCASSPCIDESIFGPVGTGQALIMWTSTTDSSVSPSNAWSINLSSGHAMISGKVNNDFAVRAVRGSLRATKPVNP